ncbi:GNAT family N-acetyltransferase [Parvularcula sp. IMCC14364]|uniref:GNAT family N-acetyltransferase n=1 Tax=Parvularcula sp. IMCC14364 TaxID=3067902 RepID=UPI002741EE85|nr:GNAT family N-acetyltransferase [Parvularcula sp. IMCC14364]
MADGSNSEYRIETVAAMADVPRESWNVLASKATDAFHPFLSFDFLEALELSGSVDPEKGWAPCHILVEKNDRLVAAMPLYFKGHSQGEYIFDHAWADAYERAGGNYYPKLLSAVPFTPVPGPRLLAENGEDATVLANAATQIAERYQVSSLHLNFTTPEQTDLLEASGYLKRMGQQFHFQNRHYQSFDAFLDTLASRKRKNLRKERSSVMDAGVEIEWLTGAEIQEHHMDQFWVFYQDTGARKWGTPYLTRTFFQLLVERMAENVLMIMARKDGQYIAGALNMIGGDTLYGRYWGCTAHIPNLHFEVCYYQAIDYAIKHGLQRVEAGAQGEHKLARGYEPVPTYSAHWIRDQGFRDAVARYLASERAHVEGDIDLLKNYTPFRKG